MYNRAVDYPPYNLRDFPRRDYSMYKPVRLKTDWRKKHSKPHHLYLKHKYTDTHRVGAEFVPPPIVIKPYDRPTILQGKGIDFIEGELDVDYLRRLIPRLNEMFMKASKYLNLLDDTREAFIEEYGIEATNGNKDLIKHIDTLRKLYFLHAREFSKAVNQLKKEHPELLEQKHLFDSYMQQKRLKQTTLDKYYSVEQEDEDDDDDDDTSMGSGLNNYYFY